MQFKVKLQKAAEKKVFRRKKTTNKAVLSIFTGFYVRRVERLMF